jgi:hypothetical protein
MRPRIVVQLGRRARLSMATLVDDGERPSGVIVLLSRATRARAAARAAQDGGRP